MKKEDTKFDLEKDYLVIDKEGTHYRAFTSDIRHWVINHLDPSEEYEIYEKIYTPSQTKNF